MSIEIGQENQSIKNDVNLLKTDGALVLTNLLKVDMPWTAAPIVSIFVGQIIDWVTNVIVGFGDNKAFALWLSVRTGKEVSVYLVDKQTGATQSAIDAAGDALIGLVKP
jgi:hypothetical protein